MKKVININFQGRVIPIEETAYEMLQQYIERLRVFFANEEGRDEIINDIEGRIAELFGETLKKGSTCIKDEDVTGIINSMGRPEDFDAEEASVQSQLSGKERTRSEERTYTGAGPKRLYRDENHKILGGVCAGLANYLNIDPVIMRILFVLFNGFTFVVYLILWVAVPSSSSIVIGSQRKRLFRDTDNKMIAGVCSGLAQYFNVQVWIPRVLFLIPFLSLAFRLGHWGWFDFPHFLSFSFSPGAVFVYIIFWLVIPEAKSAADKLEMKGEKVDLNNIKSTIQGDISGFKDRAQQFGSEVKERAEYVSENIKKNSGGIGRVLMVLLKIFVYFIVGSILFAIVVGLFVGGVVCTGLLPTYSSYIFNDGLQNLLAWGTVIFFIWVPVIAIVTWIIRRLTGKRGSRGIITLTFISLWILGWICFINVIVQLRGEFRYHNNPVEQNVSLTNRGVGRLEVKGDQFGKTYNGSWLRLEPFASLDEDTAFVGNIRLRIVKSLNDSFSVRIVKLSNGDSKQRAEELANKIDYSIKQIDSTLVLDKGIAITREEKFRNQQVVVTIAVPVGKKLYIHNNTGFWNNVHVDINNDDGYWDWENSTEVRTYDWSPNVEYVMTKEGLKRTDNGKDDDSNDHDDWNKGDDNSDDNGDDNAIENFRKSKEQLIKEKEENEKRLKEIENELKKTDSIKTHVNEAPAQTEKKATAEVGMSNGMADVLMVKFL